VIASREADPDELDEHEFSGEFYVLEFNDGDTHEVTKHELLYFYQTPT